MKKLYPNFAHINKVKCENQIAGMCCLAFRAKPEIGWDLYIMRLGDQKQSQQWVEDASEQPTKSVMLTTEDNVDGLSRYSRH